MSGFTDNKRHYPEWGQITVGLVENRLTRRLGVTQSVVEHQVTALSRSAYLGCKDRSLITWKGGGGGGLQMGKLLHLPLKTG